MCHLRSVSFPNNPNNVKSCRLVMELEARNVMERSHGDLALFPLID